jgi:hypothetical protein
MKTFAFILCSLLTTILLSNCGEQKITCAPDSHEYYYVSPKAKAVIPYKGFDTLKLKHNSGEEYTFYAGKMDSVFYIDARSTGADCANNIFEHRQGYRLEFIADNYPNLLTVSLTNAYIGSSQFEITLKKGIVFNTIATLDFPPPPSPKYDYDSLLINGKVYYHIQVLYKSTQNHADELLYNTEYGILKFIYSNGETFERIP